MTKAHKKRLNMPTKNIKIAILLKPYW